MASSVWVYQNGTELRCEPPSCIVHCGAQMRLIFLTPRVECKTCRGGNYKFFYMPFGQVPKNLPVRRAFNISFRKSWTLVHRKTRLIFTRPTQILPVPDSLTVYNFHPWLGYTHSRNGFLIYHRNSRSRQLCFFSFSSLVGHMDFLSSIWRKSCWFKVDVLLQI